MKLEGEGPSTGVMFLIILCLASLTFDFFSSLIVRFLAAVAIDFIFLITKFNYFTNSSGVGETLNLIVLIREFGNLVAKCYAASISMLESPIATMLVMVLMSKSFTISRKDLSFHSCESPGNYFS